jgi:hypothetical protein
MQLVTVYSSTLIAQKLIAQSPSPANEINAQWQGLQANLVNVLPSLIGAIVIFVVGVIIAAALAGVTRSLLRRTNLDNRLAASVMGETRGRTAHVENLFGSIVFWVVTILAAVAALNVLNLNAVSQPLNTFLGEIFGFLPRLGSAIVLGLVAWVVAILTKTLVVRGARSFGLDERFSTPEEETQNRFSLSETLGNALYWFIWLFFLPLILGVLNLQGPLQPVQNLLNEILAALPRILKAVLIGAAGWVIARIVRGIVTNLLSATGTDRLGTQFGLGRTIGSRSLSWLIGTIVYVLILIPTAIAALDALQIQAISGPAVAMLNQILSVIPQIFTAALILIIGYVVGKFVADLATNILRSIGFDNVFSWLGLRTTLGSTTAPAPSRDLYTVVDQRDDQRDDQREEPLAESTTPQLTVRTPSEIVGIIVLVGIVLFATVAATNVLNIPALTTIVTGLLIVSGRILVGLVIFAVGLYLANLAYNIISSSGGYQSRILGQIARVAIIGLVAAMALQQMGIASDIVNLAFGLLLGSIAVAIAIAFGLGGRDVAGEQTRRWLGTFQRESNGQRERDRAPY